MTKSRAFLDLDDRVERNSGNQRLVFVHGSFFVRKERTGSLISSPSFDSFSHGLMDLQQGPERGGAWYKQLLEQNKHFVQEPPTIEKCQTPANELFYTHLVSELPEFPNL